MKELIFAFLQQYAPYLLVMVAIQVILGTVAHHTTKERGWDDTWIGAIGLSIVFGAPPIMLWLAGLDARVPLAMFLQGAVIVGLVKFTEWAKRRAIVDLALFVFQTLACLLPPGLLATWLVLVPPSWVDLLESLVFVGVSVCMVGLTTLAWDWHHHTIQGYPCRKKEVESSDSRQLQDIQYVLERQADLIRELMGSNATIDRLATNLQRQQEAIAHDLDQLEKWGRIGKQTVDDIFHGISSCYVIRKGREEREEEEGEEAEADVGDENDNHNSRVLKLIGRNGK